MTTTEPNPDPTTMRNTLLWIAGALHALEPKIEENDEDAAKQIKELAVLAASSAGAKVESK